MLQKLRNTDQKGFTLIELMIVIAIIGILAAIAIPNFISYRDKSFCSAAESDARNVAAEIANYFSIPAHTAVPVETNATTYLGVALSGTNTVSVSEDTAQETITIAVTDVSNRCPSAYRLSSDRWDDSANIYTIIMGAAAPAL